MPRRILVGTDFSTRSDRALRRATLLARQGAAELVLAHVIDDDRPTRLRQAEEREAAVLLGELAETTRTTDGVACGYEMASGEPFEQIPRLAGDAQADLIVMGPHRRQALRDIFIGTTVERTIRRTRHPLLMANAVPAGAYRHVLLTCDLSDSSIGWLQAALAFSFLKDAETTVLHVFDSLAKSAMVRSALQPDDLQHQLDEETVLAKTKLREFLARAGVASHRQEVGHRTPTEAVTIHDYAEKQGMDLIVMGTQQRTGAAKYILGSVAEEVLRIAPTDVLVFPVGPFEDEETSVAARQPAR